MTKSTSKAANPGKDAETKESKKVAKTLVIEEVQFVRARLGTTRVHWTDPKVQEAVCKRYLRNGKKMEKITGDDIQVNCPDCKSLEKAFAAGDPDYTRFDAAHGFNGKVTVQI